MASILDTIYQHSPTWIQNLGVASFGYFWRWHRYGGSFPRYVDEFVAREKQTSAEWQIYQRDQLRSLLTHCFQCVPYYMEQYRNLGLDLEALRHFELEDLPRLPLLHKEEIQKRPQDFIAISNPKSKLYDFSTSGSSGTPLVVRMSADCHRRSAAAYEARCRRWAGLDHRMGRAMIGGRMVVPKVNSKPPFWRYNPAEHQVYLSAFHISPANAVHYVGALNQYRPDYMVGYASSQYFLAKMVEDQNLDVHRPRAILTSSEKLTDEMRETLERVYRCQVFDGYSGVEACCLASECSHHSLHLSPDVGIVELVNAEGVPVPSGHSGEIIATGLLNYDQPLIRYSTKDLAVASPSSCECGRAMPVLSELIGRLEDTVFGFDGRQMVRFHGIFIGIPGIREGQVIQEQLTEFRVRIVAPEGLSDSESQLIHKRMSDRLGGVTVCIDLVDRIERTAGGKFKAVICNLSQEEKRRLSRIHSGGS